MPIYEYRCTACDTRFEEYLATSDKPSPPCASCGSVEVERLMSSVNTEWQPSDVKWNRVNTSWD